MTAPPIAAIGVTQGLAAQPPAAAPPGVGRAAGVPSFSGMLLDGLERVDRKLADADAIAKAFALDDSIPVHQVTFALEQARLSFELLQQVRARLVGSYQELLRMQL
jgi:flagellar hook-basal body complex protein FliE